MLRQLERRITQSSHWLISTQASALRALELAGELLDLALEEVARHLLPVWAKTSRLSTRVTSFNQPLNNWNVSNVTDMSRMFEEASSFNQPLNNWDVSNVTDMRRMFNGARSFNQPLNNWNVSITDMSNMFDPASSFNQPLNNWNVSSNGYGIDVLRRTLLQPTAQRLERVQCDGYELYV